MKVKHNGTTYEVDFFYGTDGVPHGERGDRPHVRTKCNRSFNVSECTFPDGRKKTIGFHRDTDHEDFG